MNVQNSFFTQSEQSITISHNPIVLTTNFTQTHQKINHSQALNIENLLRAQTIDYAIEFHNENLIDSYKSVAMTRFQTSV